MSDPISVQVTILDQVFTLRSPPGQENHLREAAVQLDKRMRDIRASGRVVGLERMAIMAALNFSAEALESKKTLELTEKVLRQMDVKVSNHL